MQVVDVVSPLVSDVRHIAVPSPIPLERADALTYPAPSPSAGIFTEARDRRFALRVSHTAPPTRTARNTGPSAAH